MPGVLDLLFLALLALAFPLYNHFIDWPRFQRWLRENPRTARLRAYWGTIVQQWALAGIAAWLWLRGGRPWTGLGFVPPHGWRLWASVALVALLVLQQLQTLLAVSRSARARARVRAQIGPFTGIIPRTGAEVASSMPLALTAGICEEVLFRGYFLAALTPLLTWWGAAAIAVPVFGLLHSYQGKKGIVRTGAVGLVMTIFVATTRSLYPAMVVHAVVDVGGLLACHIALRERDEEGEAAAEPPPVRPSRSPSDPESIKMAY